MQTEENYLTETRQIEIESQFRHSFSRYYLFKHNYEILRGNEKLFSISKPPLPSSLPSYFQIHEDTIRFKTTSMENLTSSQNLKSIAYATLRNKGFIIKKVDLEAKDPFRYETGFRSIYKIIRGNELTEGYMNKIPKDYTIVYDYKNKAFKLNGLKTTSQWTYESNKKRELFERERLMFPFKRRKLFNKFEDEMIINEIPLGIDFDNNRLITMPMTGDISHIGYVGQTANGKTLAAHGHIGHLFYNDYDIIILNDWKPECYSWNLPTDENIFLKKLIPFNITPKPLPTVYLYPSFKGCLEENNQIGGDEGIAVNIQLDWSKLMTKYYEYVAGYKGMSFQNSLRYININQLSQCETYDEVKVMIEEYMGKKEIPKTSKNMVMGILSSLVDKGVTSLTSSKPTKYKVIKKSGDKILIEKELSPFMACIYSKLIPIFSPRSMEAVQISTDKKGSVIPMYMNYLINNIYEEKTSDEYFKQRNMYIFVDEMDAIMSKGVDQPLQEIAAIGRFHKTGLMWSNQMYSSIPKPIRENTKMLFVFGISKTELQAMRKDNYVIPKEIEEEQQLIGKKRSFECHVFHKRPLVAYDLETGRRINLDGSSPSKIVVLPPMSKHQKSEEG